MGEHIINPFVVGRYIGNEYFCGREEETEKLRKHVTNGLNVVLISERRMGKTGLITHLLEQPDICERYHTFFVDIYATSSLAEMVYCLSKSIVDYLRPRQKTWTKRFFDTVRSLRLGFKLDATTGEPTLDFSIGDITNAVTTLEEIFAYLENADKPCIVAIDEFQQIAEYEEKNVEAILRTHIQHTKQTSFIFAGSKRHMMAEMFGSRKRPFYMSAATMGLKPIPLATYSGFATKQFAASGKLIEKVVIKEVYNTLGGCTWFVQMMMNELFSLTPQGSTCEQPLINTALANIIYSQEDSFREILARLSAKQRSLLLAIAKEKECRNITSSGFIAKYKLLSASSVQSAARALLESDILQKTDKSYRIADYFFAFWLSKY